MEFRGFESENRKLADARKGAGRVGYSIAELCDCKVAGIPSHKKVNHGVWMATLNYELREEKP